MVAPLYEQGRVLAATITGRPGADYVGTVQAAKLKIMGVDVFSAGDWSEQHAEPVRYEDRALGIYKKLTVRDGKLAGVILVGDTSDSHRYMDWLRTRVSIADQRRHLLFPPPSADVGLDVAEMADGATICGCVGVTKGTIIQAIHDKGVNTLSQLKEMRHYSKNNVELLTTQWLMFDGDLSKLKQAGKIENLMMRQSEFHDALETVITDLEEVKTELQPATDANE